MDNDKYKLGKTREEKPEGYLSSEELFDFFQRMIDLCDEIEPLLDYEKFLGYK